MEPGTSDSDLHVYDFSFLVLDADFLVADWQPAMRPKMAQPIRAPEWPVVLLSS